MQSTTQWWAMAAAAMCLIAAGLMMPKRSLRVLPFVSPGIGYGRLSDTKFDAEAAATGFQKVLRAGGSGTAIGLAVSWNGSAARS